MRVNNGHSLALEECGDVDWADGKVVDGQHTRAQKELCSEQQEV